jgi:hypothetical protein
MLLIVGSVAVSILHRLLVHVAVRRENQKRHNQYQQQLLGATAPSTTGIGTSTNALPEPPIPYRVPRALEFPRAEVAFASAGAMGFMQSTLTVVADDRALSWVRTLACIAVIAVAGLVFFAMVVLRRATRREIKFRPYGTGRLRMESFLPGKKFLGRVRWLAGLVVSYIRGCCCRRRRSSPVKANAANPARIVPVPDDRNELGSKAKTQSGGKKAPELSEEQQQDLEKASQYAGRWEPIVGGAPITKKTAVAKVQPEGRGTGTTEKQAVAFFAKWAWLFDKYTTAGILFLPLSVLFKLILCLLLVATTGISQSVAILFHHLLWMGFVVRAQPHIIHRKVINEVSPLVKYSQMLHTFPKYAYA